MAGGHRYRWVSCSCIAASGSSHADHHCPSTSIREHPQRLHGDCITSEIEDGEHQYEKRHGDKAKFQRRDAALIELSHHCTNRTIWLVSWGVYCEHPDTLNVGLPLKASEPAINFSQLLLFKVGLP